MLTDLQIKRKNSYSSMLCVTEQLGEAPNASWAHGPVGRA